MLLDSIASPVFCDPYVRKDFLTIATLLLTSNPVDTVLGGLCDLFDEFGKSGQSRCHKVMRLALK